jgi:Fe-S cluster biogenesis protein NfuA
MHESETLALAVERRLDARVRPLLQVHGGEVTLLSVADGNVSLRFEGACVGCPLRPVTLSLTVQPALGSVAGVESVTATGVRVSPHAAARLRAAFAGHLEAPVGRTSGSPTSRTGAGDG